MKEDCEFNSDFLTDRKEWIKGFVPVQFRNLDLSSFIPRDNQKAAYDAVCEYRNELLTGMHRPLVIFGESGSGKTMLASALWNSVAPAIGDRKDLREVQLTGTADNICFVNGSDLPAIAQGKYASDNLHGSVDQMTQHICTAYFAVLDDFDKAPNGQWASKWYGVINSRIIQEGLPTVITMNHSPVELIKKFGAEYGEPIVNRLTRTGTVFIRM